MDTMLLEPEIAERAERKVRDFEARYHATLAQLEAVGLPSNADYAIHEEYIEWHYRARRLAQSEKALNTLPTAEPA